MFSNQSPCGPCGCAAADPAAGAANGLKSLWGCCKQIIPQSVCVCCCAENNKLIKKIQYNRTELQIDLSVLKKMKDLLLFVSVGVNIPENGTFR